MQLRPSRFRRVALLWAVLQLAWPAAVSVADAMQAAAATQAIGSHVEDRTGATCRAVHPPDCALCQALTTPATPARPALPEIARVVRDGAPVRWAVRGTSGEPGARPRTRAPPANA